MQIGQMIGHNTGQSGAQQLSKFYFSVFALFEQLVKGQAVRPAQSQGGSVAPSPQPQVMQQNFRQSSQSMPSTYNQPPLSSQSNMGSIPLNMNNQNAQQFTSSTDFLNQALDSMTSNATPPIEVKTEERIPSETATPMTSNPYPDEAEPEASAADTKSEEVEDDDGTYVPKTRKVHSFGGIDLANISTVLKRSRPSKEHYGNSQLTLAAKNLKHIHLSLISRLDLEVRYALDNLVIYSSENDLLFPQCAQLFNSLVEFFFEVMDKLYGNTKPCKFYNVKTLNEIESVSTNVFQSDCIPTVVEHRVLMDRLVVISMIFRNSSMNPENLEIMAKHPGFAKAVILLLNIPIPQEFVEFLENGDVDSVTTASPCNTLEHRKNAIIILSNIGSMFPIENIPTMQLIYDVCTDFISEKDGAYLYPAVDCLARLLIDVNHQLFLAEIENLPSLVDVLLALLPTRAFSYDTLSPQMAIYELVMLILCIVTLVARGPARVSIITKQLKQQMLALSKRPPSGFRVMPIEIIREFWSVRERALRIYLVCLKGARLTEEVERDLVMMMSIAQRDGDMWMSAAILEFLLDYEP